MISARQTTTVNLKNESIKTVHILLYAQLYTVEGIWQWEMQTEQLFCSTSIFELQQSHDLGTLCLLHPDDVTSVEKEIEKSKLKSNCNFNFRIITTYGEVKNVCCLGYIVLKENADFVPALRQKTFNDFLQEKAGKQYAIQEKLELLSYGSAESISNTGVWYLNTATHETWYSNEVYNIYGLPPQSLNAHFNTFTPYIHPTDKATVVDTFEKSYRLHLPVHLQYRIMLHDQQQKYIQHSTTWSFNDKGEMILSGVVEDITEQKKIELQLADLQDQLKIKTELLQHHEVKSYSGTWEMNLFTRKAIFSDNVYKIFGIKPQLISLNLNVLTTYLHPDDRYLLTGAIKKLFKENIAPDIQYRIIRKDGKQRVIKHSGKIITNTDQEFLVVGTIEDLTERVSQQRKLQKAETHLLVQSMVQEEAEDITSIASFTCNIESSEFEWSKGIYKLLGLKKTVINLPYKFFQQHIHEEDKKLFVDSVRTAMEGKEVHPFVFRLITKGTLKYIKAFLRTLNNPRTKLCIGVLQDVTEPNQVQLQVQQKDYLSQLIVNSVTDRIIVSDVNNLVLDWNCQCEKDFSITKEEAIGKNIFDLFPRLKTTNIVSDYHKVINGEIIKYNNETNTFHHHQQSRLLIPVKNEDEEVFAVLNVMRDISGEAQLQKKLNDRIGFIENLLEVSVDRIIVLDQYMNYLYWNKKAEEYYNISKEQVLGKNILEIFPGFLNDPSFSEFKSALQGKTIHIPPDETNHYSYETYLIPLKDDKQFITGVLWLVHDTSPQYQLQQIERKTTESLNALYEKYVELDTEYRFIYLNKRAEEYFEKSKTELTGQIIWEAFPAIIGSPILEAIIIAGEEKTNTSGEYLSPVTGKYIQLSATPTTEGVVIVFSDISNIKDAEDRLAQSQHFLEQVVNSSPDVITVFDLRSKTSLYMNSRTEQLFGYTQKEMMEMGHEGRLLKIIHPDDRELLVNFTDKIADAENKTIAIEYRIIQKNGSIRWIRNRGKSFKRDAAGNCSHTISILQDITDEVILRKHLDERTFIAESLFEASVDPMFVIDRQKIICAWNNRCEEYYGKNKDEAIGRTLDEVFSGISSCIKRSEGIETALNGKQVYIAATEDAGEDKITDQYFIPIYKEKNKVQTVLCVLHDLTNEFRIRDELKQLNFSLERKNLELEQKNEEIMTFAFAASHDLKEPIRKIRTFNNWLMQEEIEKLTPTGKKYLLATSRSAERLDLLLKDILLLSRIQSDTNKKKILNIKQVVDKAMEDMREQITETGTSISSTVEGAIFGNENFLIYLFRNLISNSIKFQNPGNEPLIHITSSLVEGCTVQHKNAVQDVNYLKISIKDNGFGFEQKYENKIFQIFQRLHRKEDFPGTGMGLTICKKIMEEHHGFITAESSVGEGSVFNLYFPG